MTMGSFRLKPETYAIFHKQVLLKRPLYTADETELKNVAVGKMPLFTTVCFQRNAFIPRPRYVALFDTLFY